MSLKENILNTLQNADSDISGQVLATQFGVSRNAVWKAVNALKAEGYEIFSATNKGYRLSPECDILSEREIRRHLQNKAIPVYILNTADSTNNEAKRLMDKERAEAFLVVSDMQTNGRGRQGKSYFSPKGAGLYMTLVTSPNTRLEDTVAVTAYAAVCVVQAIEVLTGQRPQIKWINDIYFNGKKICGILTEAISDFESGTVSRVITGIGINLKSHPLPEELAEIAGSLNAHSALRNSLAAEITNRLLLFDAKDSAYIDIYKQYSAVLGKRITFELNGIKHNGTVLDIQKNGYLLVDCGAQQITLKSGSIHFV